MSAPQWNGLAPYLSYRYWHIGGMITGVVITAGTLDLQVRDEKPFIGHLYQCVS
ncbi:hypothetical protein [Pseudomonas silesiensis]|uniref:hypothetical protein n=1 Tax=Pseudomonas silesiensis TaxID=1853130 RepID=UPI0030D7751D